MKKVLALVLSAMLVLALCGTAFAAIITTPTGDMTITGLNAGDTVTLYKVIGYDITAATTTTPRTAGYKVLAPFDTLGYSVADLVAMDATKASALATEAARTGSTATAHTSSGTANSTGTFTASAEPGMYLALVSSTDASIVYNPMILSINFNGVDTASDTALSVTSEALIGTSAVAKKTPVTVDKKVDSAAIVVGRNKGDDDCKTVANGDTIPYVVDTILPTYADNYTTLKFEITDTLTPDYLTLNQDSITVTVGGSPVAAGTGTYTLTKDAHGYKITFAESYLRTPGRVGDAAKVQVKYTATFDAGTDLDNLPNVQRLNNKVEVEFTHTPDGQTEKKEKDTDHYTFSLDAAIDGDNWGRDITSELRKIGVDDAGQVITAWDSKVVSEWTSHTPLQGAEFKLTRTADGAEFTATSGPDGHISFYGLDAGEYTLQETSAPTGYVTDPSVVPVKIEAFFADTSDPDKLTSYKVTVNGQETTYTVTLDAVDAGKTTSSMTSGITFPFVNTKTVVLPTTGGIGTTIFYVSGLMMVLGAAAILVARRRADAE